MFQSLSPRRSALIVACLMFSAVLIPALAAPAHGDTIISNGSFEEPVIPTNSYKGAVPASWFAVGPEFLFNGDGGSPGFWPTPEDGQQYVDIGNGVTGGGTTVSQNFQISTPGLYTLSWYDDCAAGEITGNYSVSIEDSSLNLVATTTESPKPPSWTFHSLTADMNPGTYRLSFASLGPSAADDLIDNVSMPGQAAVPEPTSWALAVSGNWSDSTKWTYCLVPNADGAVAVIAASTTTALTVTLDSPQSIVGMLILGSGSTTTGYTLSGSTLTFSNTSNSTAAAISVIDGTHAINAPVILASNLVVTSTSSNPWTLSFGTASSITDNGNNLSLTMSASNGTLILSGSDDYTGGTIVTAGTLDVTNPEAIFTETSLIVGENAQSVFTASSVFGASATSGAVPEPGMLSLLGVSALGFSLGIREPRPVVRARKTENASAKVGGSVS